ncbi:hypothetical protein PSHT_08160 [Puccinia striiformis]|uniref:Uncharacterized protein n=2 Tax=Puccinia striiformis TaxID=27350 RepID=A0A2S4VRS3_9BASI|nr:hypothetical protein PSHT_08160 [Puccinia striiformis]
MASVGWVNLIVGIPPYLTKPMLPYLPVEFDWENFLATTLLDALGNTIMCALAGLVIAVTLIIHKLLTPQQDKFTKQQLTAISKG